jgi:hypothetical protein
MNLSMHISDASSQHINELKQKIYELKKDNILQAQYIKQLQTRLDTKIF